MDINRFEAQGTLTTDKGDSIPIEIYRHNNKINLVVDRYQLKRETGEPFNSNYNYVIIGHLLNNGKIATYAWKAGIDGYKLKVDPKNELVQLVGILTDMLYIDNIQPIGPGTQHINIEPGLDYEFNFDSNINLKRIIRHDDPGLIGTMAGRSHLVIDIDAFKHLSSLPYQENCDNYVISLDYFNYHVSNFIDAMTEPKPKPRKFIRDCSLGQCGDQHSCSMSGCIDNDNPYPAGFPLWSDGKFDFNDTATTPVVQIPIVPGPTMTPFGPMVKINKKIVEVPYPVPISYPVVAKVTTQRIGSIASTDSATYTNTAPTITVPPTTIPISGPLSSSATGKVISGVVSGFPDAREYFNSNNTNSLMNNTNSLISGKVGQLLGIVFFVGVMFLIYYFFLRNKESSMGLNSPSTFSNKQSPSIPNRQYSATSNSYK